MTITKIDDNTAKEVTEKEVILNKDVLLKQKALHQARITDIDTLLETWD